MRSEATATLPSRTRRAGTRMAATGKSTETRPMAAADLVPEQLLDGGEIVLLAIKPSLWFVLFASIRWLIGVAIVIALAPAIPSMWPGLGTALIVRAAMFIGAARVGFAVLDWVSRLYVLTNRRVMRLRGIFNVNLFECSLLRIQNTYLTLAWYERLFGLGSIGFATAGTGGVEAVWRHLAQPMAVHEQVRAAISRARGQGPMP